MFLHLNKIGNAGSGGMQRERLFMRRGGERCGPGSGRGGRRTSGRTDRTEPAARLSADVRGATEEMCGDVTIREISIQTCSDGPPAVPNVQLILSEVFWRVNEYIYNPQQSVICDKRFI